LWPLSALETNAPRENRQPRGQGASPSTIVALALDLQRS